MMRKYELGNLSLIWDGETISLYGRDSRDVAVEIGMTMAQAYELAKQVTTWIHDEEMLKTLQPKAK